MILQELQINNFRNISRADLEFSDNFNFIFGANGSGKTSLLESIFYLGHGKSFKSSLNNRIIQYGVDSLVLHAKTKDTNLDLQYSIGIAKSQNGGSSFEINGSKGHKLAKLTQMLPLQIINPESLKLLYEGAVFRRAFLDWGIFYQETDFLSLWSKIKHIIKQRNAILGFARSYAELELWDIELVKLANKISQLRQEYATKIGEHILASCEVFLPKIEISCEYYQGWSHNEDLAEILVANFNKDRKLGYSSVGPHRADFRLLAFGMPIQDSLSRGQIKLFMFALKLVQGLYLMSSTDHNCIFLIDDFASELDGNNQLLLARYLQNCPAQVFISAINKEQLDPFYQSMNLDQAKYFSVKNGCIG